MFSHAEVALTRTNNRVDARPRPRGRIAADANDILLTNDAFALACMLGRRFPTAIREMNRIVTRLAGSGTRVDRSDRIFASPRLVRFTEMEYVLPRAATPAAVRRVVTLIPERGFDVRFRSRCAPSRRTTRCRPRRCPGQWLRGRHMSRACPGSPTSAPSRRSWRSSAAVPLGQASPPDGRNATSALPRVGPLPGGARAPGSGRALRDGFTDRVLGPVAGP